MGQRFSASITNATVATAFGPFEVVPMDAGPAALQHFRPALSNQQLPQSDFL